MRRRFAALVVALVFGSFLMAAPASAATVNVSAQNFAFNPDPVQVEAGDTVTWTNNDAETHTVTADDGSFSLAINPGESASHTFAATGVVPYYCKIHGGPGGQGMSGTVHVGSGTPPPTVHLSGADNVARSIAWSSSTFPDGAGFALLGRADGFADSLSTGAVQGKLHAPLLLTGSASLDPRVKAELARLKPHLVYLFGGTAALSSGVANELASSGYTVRRVAGADRLGTAVAAAETFFPEATSALIVRAFGDSDPTRAFADSLAAGALAATTGQPTLFSVTNALSGATKTYLQQHPMKSVTLIGGTGALSDQVEKDAGALGISVDRIAGFSRYDTARIVSGNIDSTEAVLVDGTNANAWADGFAAAARGAHVYLTRGDQLSGATAQDMANADDTVGIVCGTTTTAKACTRAEQARGTNIDFPQIGAVLNTTPDSGGGSAAGLYAFSPTDLCYDVFALNEEAPVTLRRTADNSVVLTENLEPSTDNDPFGCTYDLPAATIADIKANPADYTIQIDTPNVLKGTVTNVHVVATAFMLGEAEVPGPGDPNGGGFGFVLSTDTPNQLCIGMAVFGFGSDPTAAHIHDGDTGVSGPVVVPLATPASGDFSESIDCYAVASALATDIIAHPAGYYINVHTSQFPNGAARGQLIPAS
jgi:putative cell wall-binding protein